MAAMGKQLITSIILITLTSQTRSQFFDFFPSLSLNNPFQYDTTPTNLIINRRPEDYFTTQPKNRKNQNNNYHRTTSNLRTTRATSTTEKYNEDILNIAINKHIPFSSFINGAESDSNIYSFANNENSYSTSSRTPSTTTRKNKNINRGNINYNNNNRNNNNRSDRKKTTTTEASFHIKYGSNDKNNNDDDGDEEKPVNNQKYNNNVSINNNNNRNNERENNYSVNSNINNNVRDNNYSVNSNNNYNNNDARDNNYSFYNNERTSSTENTNNNRRVNTNQNSNVNDYENNNNSNKNNNIFDDNYYNRRPFDDVTTKSPFRNSNVNFNYEDSPRRTTARTRTYTTQTPIYNRPGVRPAVFEGPPITNRPTETTENPYKTRGFDGINFPDENASDEPVLMTGPDVDNLSEAQKRRLNNLADKMCDRWRALNLKQVQAIPLLPSPDAVRVNVTECASPTPLIVGGRGVTIEQFPHQAAVGWRKSKSSGHSWKCGGTLVSELYIMTAAHCTYQERDEDVDIGPPQAVQLGSTNLDGRNAVIYKVAAAIRHPNYKLPKSYFDIALLKLTSRVRFSNTIRPACLGEPPFTGEKIVAAGWGRTEFGGDQSKELRAVSVTVWNIRQCRTALGTSRKLPEGVSSASQFCAGEKRGGKDTCQGDSGGAALLRSGCVWVACGVTSLGRGCGSANVPAVYARAHIHFVAALAFT